MRNGNQQKSILITGAASGIGRATALLFAERGWFVGLFDVNEKELRVVAETIGESSCRYQALDVTDPVSYEQAIKYFGAIRGLTEALNIESQRHGISVSDIMPLYVNTPMVANQAYRPGSMRLFGTRLIAAQVAKVVWKTAHGTRVHWSPTFTGTMIDTMSRLFPPLQRAALRFISAKPA